MLGERLKAEGFKGNIYASPYLRTVETAVEIAKVTGGKVALNPLIQERTHKLGSPDIKGRTQSELSKIFPGMILESPKLEYPWVYTDNSGEKLKENVEKAIQEALKADGRDFILVGHKATVKASVISSVIGYASPAMERNPHLRGSAYPMKAETRYMAVIATVIQSNILMRIDMCFFFAICSDFFA